MKLRLCVVGGALLATFGFIVPIGCANSTPDGATSFGDDDASAVVDASVLDATASDGSHVGDAASHPTDSGGHPLDGASPSSDSGDPADAAADVDAACGLGTCGWCCTSARVCLTGPSDTQCGSSGADCVDCTATGLVCDTSNGTCAVSQPCGAATCPNGCCKNGVCTMTELDTVCGTGGGSCSDCTLHGEICNNGTCGEDGGTPDPDCEFDCDGCCDANLVCHNEESASACGIEGVTCVDCSAQSGTCTAGSCTLPDGAVEDPNCLDDCVDGCCDQANVCHTGASGDTLCGTNGGSCLDCTLTGATCIGGFCSLPDGAVEDPNCAIDCENGCCDEGNVCQAGTSRTQCGEFGEPCTSCVPLNLVCVANTCQ